MNLRLQLLGPPRVTSNGVTLELGSDKPLTLLYYLSQRNDWVSRSELAFLYRPDADDQTAFSNIRKLLHRAREYAWTTPLETEKLRVRFLIDSDVQSFRQAVAQQRWSDALEIHRGVFLEGLGLPDTPGFEAWLELERVDLNRLWRQAGHHHALALEQAQDWVNATRVLQVLLKADPLDEDALQVYLRVLSAQGQRRQAFEVFETFCQTLQHELDAEPLESTRALVDSIRQPAASSMPTAPQPPNPLSPASHNLPAPTTRFIGRKRELAHLMELLAQPDTRLVTLMGLGGTGKTRLALELAWQQLEHHTDGVWFVPLAGIASSDLIVPGMASALGFGFSGLREPKQQLLDYLREKNLLIVLDNFEHLIEAAVFVNELLEAAPQLKLLATSRMALELSSEWLFDVDGLAYPPRDTTENLEGFDAVRLFLNRVERVSSSGISTKDTLEAVAEICRKVEGLPLALELAATWTRSLSATEIARALETSLELLSTQQRDIPERHRSITVVFEHSWAQLGGREREALERLSVFQGGFTLSAAERVAGAHLALLLALVNRMLVRRTPAERFDLHELVRQYGQAQLERDPEAKEAALDQHRMHYATLLGSPALRARDPATLSNLEAEMGNVRLAWNRMIEQARWSEVQDALEPLHNYYEVRGSPAEGVRLFLAAAERLEGDGQNTASVLAHVLRCAGVCARRQGAYTEAIALLERSVGCFRQAGETAMSALPLKDLGFVAEIQGRFEEARALYLEARDLLDNADERVEMAHVLVFLGSLDKTQGRYESARGWLEEAIRIYETAGLTDRIAIALNTMANIAEAEHDHEAAQALYRRCLPIFEAMNHTQAIAVVTGNLGIIAEQLGHLEEARDLSLRSLELKRQIGFKRGIALTLINLGGMHEKLGDLEQSRRCLIEGIRVSQEIGALPRIMQAFNSLAYLFRHAGRDDLAERLLLVVIHHPSTSQEIRDRARDKLTALWDADRVAKLPDPAYQSEPLERLLARLEMEPLLNEVRS